MKAEIKWFEYGSTMEDYFTPTNLSNFNELVTLLIGPKNFDGGDYFHFHITTPEWFIYSFELEGEFSVEWGRHQLIVPHWNQELIEAKVRAIVDKNGEGEEWVKIAERLGRYFHWEFEDYKEL